MDKPKWVGSRWGGGGWWGGETWWEGNGDNYSCFFQEWAEVSFDQKGKG